MTATDLSPIQVRFLAALEKSPALRYHGGFVRIAFRDRLETFEVPQTTIYALRDRGLIVVDARGVRLP